MAVGGALHQSGCDHMRLAYQKLVPWWITVGHGRVVHPNAMDVTNVGDAAR